MFHFSFYEYVLHDFIVNKKADAICDIKAQYADESIAVKKIAQVVKSIVGGYIKSAGITSCIQKLDTLYQDQKNQMAALADATAHERLSFFSSKGRKNDAGVMFYSELMEYVMSFSTVLLRAQPEDFMPSKLMGMVLRSGFTQSIFSVLNQIHHYIDSNYFPPMTELFDFHEYLAQINLSIHQASRIDLLHYLKQLESYLSSFLIPVNGDTHFKTVSTEIVAEISKVRNKLLSDEKRELDIEIVKLRAFNIYILSRIHEPSAFLPEYQDYVQKNIQKVLEQDFDSSWRYVNSEGFLNNHTDLLSTMGERVGYLKRILSDKSEFDAVIQKIDAICQSPSDKLKPFKLYRYISEGEFQSLKSTGLFTQHHSLSTSENAKWFYYGQGKPGVTNAYLCEVSCVSAAQDIIREYQSYPHAVLVKENEPDCVGIHEEVLADFNRLISGIRVTHVETNKTIEIKMPGVESDLFRKLPLNEKEQESSLYFGL